MNKRYFFKSRIFKYLLFFILLLRLCLFNCEINKYKEPEYRSFIATVCNEPKRYFDKQVLVLCSDEPYKVQVTTAIFPSYDLYDKLLVKCKLKIPENYSDFDYKTYLNKQDIYFTCYSWSIKKLNEVDYSSLNISQKIKYKLWSFKMKIANRIERNLPEPGAGLSKAMFLGLKTELEPKLKKSLENNGLAHILAISGMHIAILYALFFSVLKRLRFNNIIIKFLISIILIIYLAIISFSVSASRAVIMVIISFSANTRRKSLNRLYLTAFIMLLISPNLITSPAMQMSFLAVWSLLSIMPRLDYYIIKKISRLKLKIKGGIYSSVKLKLYSLIIKVFKNKYFKYFYFLFLASLAVNIILWPLLLYYFDLYNTLSILLNLLILPIIPVILTLIILGISLGSIGSIAKIFFVPLYFIFKYFYIVASFDFSAFYLKLDISIYFLIFYYLFILLYFQITKNRLQKNLLFVKNI
ncbi:ComEC family competence protein [Patescibacteria group bacterium]|nr:ComEC family competence protein [Patescibacteria group bacterium]